jgi:hypothetical protein
MFVNGSGWNEQTLQRTFQRCFLPSYGSFGQTVSEEKNFKNLPIRNKNRLWWPCLLMDRDQMCKLYRGPSIDASYNVSVHLAKGFQRRRSKCEKLTDDRRRTPSDGKSSSCLWQGELKKQCQCHLGCHFGKVTSTKLILTTQCFHMHLKFQCKSTKGSVTCDFYRSYIVLAPFCGVQWNWGQRTLRLTNQLIKFVVYLYLFIVCFYLIQAVLLAQMYKTVFQDILDPWGPCFGMGKATIP